MEEKGPGRLHLNREDVRSFEQDRRKGEGNSEASRCETYFF
jgi:hypothetical protein